MPNDLMINFVPAWRVQPSKKGWSVKTNERCNEFLSLKHNILRIQSVLVFLHAILHNLDEVFLFFIEYTLKVVRKVSSEDETI